MKKLTVNLIALLLLLGFSATAAAGDDIVSIVEQGCATEIEQFCSQVMPGEGRMLACFFAHEDKISGQCQYALYTASAALEQAIVALDYVATECQEDIVNLCANVQVGEGRVLDCLKANQESVSEACTAAVNKVFE